MRSGAPAHHWQRVLESGECASITELAAAEKINRSYLCRVLRLTLLAPEIVEAILDARQSESVTLPVLMMPFRWIGRPQCCTSVLLGWAKLGPNLRVALAASGFDRSRHHRRGPPSALRG